MSTICQVCGERLRAHRDGKCDPVARKRYNRKLANQFRREELSSINMVRGTDSMGRKIWE